MTHPKRTLFGRKMGVQLTKRHINHPENPKMTHIENPVQPALRADVSAA